MDCNRLNVDSNIRVRAHVCVCVCVCVCVTVRWQLTPASPELVTKWAEALAKRFDKFKTARRRSSMYTAVQQDDLKQQLEAASQQRRLWRRLLALLPCAPRRDFSEAVGGSFVPYRGSREGVGDLVDQDALSQVTDADLMEDSAVTFLQTCKGLPEDLLPDFLYSVRKGVPDGLKRLIWPLAAGQALASKVSDVNAGGRGGAESPLKQKRLSPEDTSSDVLSGWPSEGGYWSHALISLVLPLPQLFKLEQPQSTMVEYLEVGMRLHAMYKEDGRWEIKAGSLGEYYPATVANINPKKKKAPVKVHYTAYGEEADAWVSLDMLKSKALPKEKAAKPAKATEKKTAPKAKVVAVNLKKKGTPVKAELDLQLHCSTMPWLMICITTIVKTPLLFADTATIVIVVNFIGYDKQYDEWLGADRLRSKAIVPLKEKEGSKAPFGAIMPPMAKKYLLVKAKVKAPLDPGFCPLILAKQKYLEATKECTDKIQWALPREEGCARYSLPVFPETNRDSRASAYLAGVLIQEMIWQRSASSLILFGPPKICQFLQKCYSVGGAYEFEVMSMPNVCGTPDKPFEVKIVENESDLPAAFDTPQVCGKDASGCRLAFDLGKSDIKTVAVKDNDVVYSKETEWDVTNPDPQYHYDAILAALKLAKETLPKVDAIGGSATGTVSAHNEATWCDIFPNVPPDVYKEKVVDIFVRLGKEIAGDVPLKVINDGEVTALAAVQKIKSGNVMGISMGSSEGAGYANADGNLMGWISELCYCRLDLNPKAPTDPWSKGAHRRVSLPPLNFDASYALCFRGLSHMYLGQRGTTKLAAKGGVEVPANYKYPHADMVTIKHENHAQCLKLIQEAMKTDKEPEVRKIYETVGVYLGYALAQYSEFYKIDHVMILGRVSKGKGGDIMLDTAKKVLQEEFPQFSHITFHTADDHFKAVGQCIAAAALPELKCGALSIGGRIHLGVRFGIY
ncbi:SPAC4G8.04 [Symbiodinium sp. CCMP2456]|nr:SPAC4G8.04 [Symbiodinium sp. CCMP2456]